MNDPLFEQLKQIANAPVGVWAGDLVNKEAARELVRLKLAANTGGPPSSLNILTVTDRGMMDFVDGCVHDFQGWQEFEDGRGGTQVCSKCNMSAMAHSLRHGP